MDYSDDEETVILEIKKVQIFIGGIFPCIQQTTLAALKTGSHFVGYEVNEEYLKLTEKRILSLR